MCDKGFLRYEAIARTDVLLMKAYELFVFLKISSSAISLSNEAYDSSYWFLEHLKLWTGPLTSGRHYLNDGKNVRESLIMI